MIRLDMRLDSQRADEASAVLAERAPQGWQEAEEQDGTTVFTIHLDAHPLADELASELSRVLPGAEIVRQEVEEEDWSMAWRDFFTPIAAGDVFEILPPWLQDERDPGRETIVIEPKMAFGTGHHPTTALCLQAIGDLLLAGRLRDAGGFLDLGCGSGILAIGLAKAGLSGTGVDIDPQAVACARENLERNRVADRVELACGSIDALSPDASFDVIAANILSEPLIAMASPITQRLSPGGVLLLSGLLIEQAEQVESAYTALGLPPADRLEQGEWAALVIDRANA
ncbi:50S ribosomal protein L11 methyltransferase [Desulfohalovibrio reitneri]|uniref:50S ribosomal protein L11 methyltransferase n=1 Tax=Desulfohalovibrio reitneri TaxID=1307759 RepID=UPI0004A6F90B|nr:50S ribosomal protein L11 methyltransferase [Desulfohalovibrio reitneri]